jgi:glyoxylase-like metal-dependent hydrolase (beta-lactamase superfamily II)
MLSLSKYAAALSQTFRRWRRDPHDPEGTAGRIRALRVALCRQPASQAGFTQAVAERRKHTFHRCPADGLRLIGVDPEQVEDVIITHMHWDHVGNFDKFPKARFHVQDTEMRYITGSDVHWKGFKAGVMVEDVCHLIHHLYADRVIFHDGNAELAPGISVHFVGGHTMGHQIARVRTKRGWVVVASDAAHFYANMEERMPFPAVYNVGENLQSFDTAQDLAESPDHVVPGHDPLVMQRYPAPSPDLEGIAVRLDKPPA